MLPAGILFVYPLFVVGLNPAGSGVSSSVRRAKMRLATSCNNNQVCGKFYSQIGVNWNVVSPYTTDQ